MVLDRLEPLRPVVDGLVLKLVLEEEFSPGDFTITREGFCRLNPRMARKVVVVTSAALADWLFPILVGKIADESLFRCLVLSGLSCWVSTWAAFDPERKSEC